MKTIILIPLVVVLSCNVAAAQQKPTGYPAYDNIHLERSVDKQRLRNVSALPVIGNNTEYPKNAQKYLSNSDCGFLSYKAGQQNMNAGSAFIPHNTTYLRAAPSGLFLLPAPAVKPLNP